MSNTKSHLGAQVSLDDLEKIPGQFGDRRTMLGELNWIFTAITDTIAWNTLPRETFQKLFRQDLLVASLFRNFLLAERILRSVDCTPVSNPPLPNTHQHPMWDAWDMAVDMCLSQLKGIMEGNKPYAPSNFFEEQLTAFEVWLSQGSEQRLPPEQLPIVLQVLLSQAHRLRALDLLGRFLDLGPWAVNLVLSVGIYPYVLKLLQANARELRPLLVFLWAKILAVDGSCQQDLVREQSHKYFLAVLQDAAMLPDHKTWSVFVLSSIVQGYKPGQDEALAGNLITLCLNELDDKDPVLRQWLAVCLGRIWDKHEEARWRGARDNAPEQLYNLLSDPVAEVRAAAVYALGTFLNSCGKRTDHANSLDQTIALKLLQMTLEDGSPLVRRELIVALQWIVSTFLPTFINLCKALMDEDEEKMRPTGGGGRPVSPKPGGHMLRAISEDKIRRKSEMPYYQRKSSRVDTSTNSTSMIANSTSFSEIPTACVGDNVVSGSNPRKSRKCITPSLTSSYSALASLSTFTSTSKFKPFFLRVWGGLLLLEKDPDPSVALLARALLDVVWRKMVEKDRATDIHGNGSHADQRSMSAPSSPIRPTFLIGSPPTNMNTTLPVHLEPAENSRNSGSWMQRSIIPDINEEGMLIEEGESNAISTQFIEWSSRYFSTQLMTLNESSDLESESYWHREWMYSRNNNLLKSAESDRRSLMDGSGKFDEHIGVAKSTQIPSVIAMHPFDQEVIVAGRDTISVHDFSHPLQRPVSFHNRNPKISQITALEFINGHEDGLLVSGSDDGVVRVYKDWQKEHKLVTAWNLLPELVPQSVAGNRLSSGLCLAWNQKEQLLAGAGDTKYVRLWDCQTEVKLVDLPSATDSIVTNLTVNDESGLLAASYYDGSIRLYDPRIPASRARVMMYREHGKPIVACRSQNNGRLVSGCTDGKVKVWDVRRQSSISTFETGQNLIILDIHQSAPLFAGWTMSSQLNVYNLKTGELHHQFRYHEGLLGHRLGSINCIRFHPNMLRLAAGTAESEISLFGHKRM
jgi:regulator-associated protein of mTOR